MPSAAQPFFPPKPRPNAAQRGYDAHWTRLRALYVKAHPFCEDCLANESKQVPVCIVDHKQPFTSLTDPLRLAWSNLRSLCRTCHATKTHKDKSRGLTTLYEGGTDG
jgi:5-methylcytosine-specific restriction enzyme A